MKKRFISFVLVLGLSFSMVACGTNADAKQNQQVPEEQAADTESKSKDTEKVEFEEVEETEPIIDVVVEDKAHSEEYKEAFEKGVKCGGSFAPNGTAAKYDNWQEAYKALVEELDYDDTTMFDLVYVDDDDVPELIYKLYENTVSMATFDGDTGEINIATCNTADEVYYLEKNNAIKATARSEATYYDTVYAIKDSAWILLTKGTRAPLDAWAEDSFDENGEPIISYWEIDSKELSNEKEYDELLGKYFDAALQKEILVEQQPDAILHSIDESK